MPSENAFDWFGTRLNDPRIPGFRNKNPACMPLGHSLSSLIKLSENKVVNTTKYSTLTVVQLTSVLGFFFLVLFKEGWVVGVQYTCIWGFVFHQIEANVTIKIAKHTLKPTSMEH